jgi:hypothetical protein
MGMLTTERATKLSAICASYRYERSMARRREAEKAGKLWENVDFENYCSFCVENIVDSPVKPTRVFRA